VDGGTLRARDPEHTRARGALRTEAMSGLLTADGDRAAGAA